MPIVEVPGMGDVEFPDDMSDEQIVAAIQRNLAPQPKQEGLGLGRAAGVVSRAAQSIVTAPPLMAMDLGVGLRNVGSDIANRIGAVPAINKVRTRLGMAPVEAGEQYELPSQMYGRAMTQVGVPEPQGMLEKGGSLLIGAIGGSKLPSPTINNPAPKGFLPPAQAMRNQALAAAQKEGYVTPPASNNPSFGNRFLEGLSGKLKLQQEAASRNQTVTDKLMARSIGQNPTVPLTQGSLPIIRAEAHKIGYEPLRAIGKITADEQYIQSLDDITKVAQGAARSFPGLKPQNQIDEIVGTLKQKEFDSGDAVDAVSHLRELADDAYGSGNKLLGKAYKSASKAIEDMIERHLASQGDDGAALLKNYRNARQLMAKTYTAGKALSGDSGNFNAHKMASELAKARPLTGDQKTVADFATRFRKASALQTESFPSISPLDAYGSAIAAGSSGSVAPLMIPLTRVGLREYLLSPAGQQRAMMPTHDPRRTLGAMGAFPPLYQGLFAD